MTMNYIRTMRMENVGAEKRISDSIFARCSIVVDLKRAIKLGIWTKSPRDVFAK